VRWCVAQMIPELCDRGGDSDALLAHERCVPWQARTIAMPYLGAVEVWRQVYRRLARAEHKEVAAYVARTGRALLRELGQWPSEPLARLEAVRRLGLLVQGAVESHGIQKIAAPLNLPGVTAIGETEPTPPPQAFDRGAFAHPRDLKRMIQKMR